MYIRSADYPELPLDVNVSVNDTLFWLCEILAACPEPTPPLSWCQLGLSPASYKQLISATDNGCMDSVFKALRSKVYSFVVQYKIKYFQFNCIETSNKSKRIKNRQHILTFSKQYLFVVSVESEII